MDNAARHGGSSTTVEVVGEVVRGELGIEIVDHGPGLPESEHLIFDGIGETSLDHGSGLGLWLAYWILDSQGGEMTLLDASDGTSVRVRVPLVQTSV